MMMSYLQTLFAELLVLVFLNMKIPHHDDRHHDAEEEALQTEIRRTNKSFIF